MAFFGWFTEFKKVKEETDPTKMWEYVRDFYIRADSYITNDLDAMAEFRGWAESESNEEVKFEFNYIE